MNVDLYFGDTFALPGIVHFVFGSSPIHHHARLYHEAHLPSLHPIWYQIDDTFIAYHLHAVPNHLSCRHVTV